MWAIDSIKNASNEAAAVSTNKGWKWADLFSAFECLHSASSWSCGHFCLVILTGRHSTYSLPPNYSRMIKLWCKLVQKWATDTWCNQNNSNSQVSARQLIVFSNIAVKQSFFILKITCHSSSANCQDLISFSNNPDLSYTGCSWCSFLWLAAPHSQSCVPGMTISGIPPSPFWRHKDLRVEKTETVLEQSEVCAVGSNLSVWYEHPNNTRMAENKEKHDRAIWEGFN